MSQKIIVMVSGIEKYSFPAIDYFVNTQKTESRYHVTWERFGMARHGVQSDFKSRSIKLGDLEIDAIVTCSHLLGPPRESAYRSPSIIDCLMAIDNEIIKSEDLMEWLSMQATWVTSRVSKLRLSIETHSAIVHGKLGETYGAFLVSLCPDRNRKHPTLVIEPITEDSVIINHKVETISSRLIARRDRAEAQLNRFTKQIEEFASSGDKALEVCRLDLLSSEFVHSARVS